MNFSISERDNFFTLQIKAVIEEMFYYHPDEMVYESLLECLTQYWDQNGFSSVEIHQDIGRKFEQV